MCVDRIGDLLDPLTKIGRCFFKPKGDLLLFQGLKEASQVAPMLSMEEHYKHSKRLLPDCLVV
jgi:hypothetical protein